MAVDISDSIILDQGGVSTATMTNRLDFTDCILDSPLFRNTLRTKYSNFKDINNHFKTVMKNALALKDQQKKYLAAYKTLLQSIREHSIPKGDDLTQDESTAYNAVFDFAEMMQLQEEKCQTVQEAGLDALIAGLNNYQKVYDNLKEDYKKFEKATEKYCQSQEKYLSISTKKKNDQSHGYVAHSSVSSTGSLEEMDRTMLADTATFHNVSTDIVWNVLEMEETTRLNFIQFIYEFTKTYMASFVWGYLDNVKRFQSYYPFLEDVVSSSNEQMLLTAEEARSLRNNILKDPQLAMEERKQLYDRQGYLWVYDSGKKKSLVSSTHANKYFCQYRVKERQLTMMQYHQVYQPKNLTVEFYSLKVCCRRATSESERQFLFDLTLFNAEKGQVNLTMQAQSNEDRAQWLNVMEGEEPIYEDFRKFQSLGVYELDERGIEFLQFVTTAIETAGGLETEGTYRKPGGAKKVSELLEAFFILRDVTPIMQDPNEVEIKTLTSALKRFLTELKEPLIPYHLYYKLINVIKNSGAGGQKLSQPEQLDQIHAILHQLPDQHFVAMKVIVRHLNRVMAASEHTKMDAANMATCVGTSLLHSEGKSIANVMEIKFVNQIVLLILSNYDRIFETVPPGMTSSSKLTAAHVKVSKESGYCSRTLPSNQASVKRSCSADSLSEKNGAGVGGGSPFKRGGLTRSSLKASKANRPSSLQTNHSSRMKNSPSANQISPTLSSSNEHSSNPPSASQTPLPENEAERKMNPFGPKNTCVRTLYDCTGDPNIDELSFTANQIIVNVTVTSEPGWLRGTLNGRTGLFPANYCQLIDSMECFKLGGGSDSQN